MPEPEHKTSSPIAARFSSAASTYHRHANIQRRVAKKLMILLAAAKSGMPSRPVPSRILEIGCGTGLLTEKLARAFPSARIDALDISAAMTAEGRKNLAGNKMINWITADARELLSSRKYSLIASSCALHWITPIELIIAKLRFLLTRDGRLAIAVMTRGTLAELHACRNRIAPHKPSPVILPIEADVREMIVKAGLTIITEKSETIRREYSSAKEILRRLHDQGLTGGNIPRHKILLTRSEISRLIADYKKKYRVGRRVYATYRVLYCVAGKRC